MTQIATSTEGQLVLVGARNGVALIPSSTPLTRLNYFDGKFLRAEDLTAEQNYLRSLVQYSNRAGGAGIVHGFTATRGSGDTVSLSAGLAIDPAGRVLFLPHNTSVSILELIERSREAAADTSDNGDGNVGESAFAPCETAAAQPPSVTTTFPTDLYLIALVHAEALCGEEDVYGKLCEDACVTSTDRPFRTEGVLIRALPLTLCPPTCNADWLTATHRRSQVASAYFATERALNGKDMSGTRLMLDVWCKGAQSAGGSVVPLAIVSMDGDTVEFLDAWTARRERIEAPPRRYWSWQLMMRPWNVYLAQILQFQCHLHWALSGSDDTPGGGAEPCAPQNDALRQAISLLEEMESYAAAAAENGLDDSIFRPDFLTRIADLKSDWSGALASADAPAGTRILITEGIVELPPAGYLPVVPGGLDVNTQVRRLLGDGVDLRFCSVRPDYVAHALEEAQHMERICLLRGIENAAEAEEVDILVPDGIVTDQPARQGMYFETTFGVTMPSLSVDTGEVDPDTNEPVLADRQTTSNRQGPQFRGAGRGERLSTGGGAFHFAGQMVQNPEQVIREVQTQYETVGTANLRDNTAFRFTNLNLGTMFNRFSERSEMGGVEARRTARTANMQTRATATSSAAPAIWTTMRCEKNPFTLAIGESSDLRLEAAIGANMRGNVLGARLMLQGDFFCDQKPSSATAQRVRGRAWGWLRMNARIEAQGQVATPPVQPRFVPVTADVQLRPSPGGGGGTLSLDITTEQGFEFSITTEWNGEPVLAGLNVTLDLLDMMGEILADRIGENNSEAQQQLERYLAQLEEQNPGLRAVEIARARLRENPEVADEANSHHAAAVRAARTIELALDEDGFQARAEQLLFPPSPPRTDDNRILPTRDWVLFHRRRTNSCDCCRPERPVAAPPRRYQVYEITAPEAVGVDQLVEYFESGEESVERYAEIVGVVQFDGGTAQLSAGTSADQIRNAWRLANPEDSIIYGAIANVGAAVADPETLGEQRAARVADIVRSVTPLDPRVVFDVLPFVPEGLSAEGVDGVIFLVTIPEQTTTQCQRVIALRDQQMMSFVLERIGRGELAEIIEENYGLGEVTFEAGGDAVVDDSLEPVHDAWRERWSRSSVARAVVVLPSEGAIEQPVAESQALAVIEPLNGQLSENTLRRNEDVFGDCDSILILEPTQVIIE